MVVEMMEKAQDKNMALIVYAVNVQFLYWCSTLILLQGILLNWRDPWTGARRGFCKACTSFGLVFLVETFGHTALAKIVCGSGE